MFFFFYFVLKNNKQATVSFGVCKVRECVLGQTSVVAFFWGTQRRCDHNRALSRSLGPLPLIVFTIRPHSYFLPDLNHLNSSQLWNGASSLGNIRLQKRDTAVEPSQHQGNLLGTSLTVGGPRSS